MIVPVPLPQGSLLTIAWTIRFQPPAVWQRPALTAPLTVHSAVQKEYALTILLTC